MSDDFAIHAENIGKQYQLGHVVSFKRTLCKTLTAIPDMFKKKSTFSIENESEHFWALKNISFEVKHGEVIGIVGRNGAGKSTLLKILSRITAPSTGHCKIRGRIVSLLEVGTGFHQELTGRENIYLNGAILGMTRQEIKQKFEEIVAFAEIEKFLDTPVKRYSSGMSVRLAFAVAAHLEPEILLVDEVLAVGDASFQKKCLGKMENVVNEGRTVLFVSHNMGAIRTLCTKGFYLNKGALSFSGPVEEVIDMYLKENSDDKHNKIQKIEHPKDDSISLTKFWVEDKNGHIVDKIFSGGHAAFIIEYESSGAFKGFSVAFGVFDILGNRITRISMMDQNLAYDVNGPGKIRCVFEKAPFSAGKYFLTIGAYRSGTPLMIVQHAVSFEVADADFFDSGATQKGLRVGPILVEHQWQKG